MSEQENINSTDNCQKSILCNTTTGKICKKALIFTPNRRKYIPSSLRGGSAILPAITVCNQDPYLPIDEIVTNV